MKRLGFLLFPSAMDVAVAMSHVMVNLRALDLGASATEFGKPHLVEPVLSGLVADPGAMRAPFVLAGVVTSVTIAMVGFWPVRVAARSNADSCDQV